MINPGSHASADAAESDIRHEIDGHHASVIPVEIDADVEARGDARQPLQAVVAANDTHVILVQSEGVLLHDQSLGRARGHPGEAGALEAHAELGAALLSQIARLKKKRRD